MHIQIGWMDGTPILRQEARQQTQPAQHTQQSAPALPTTSAGQSVLIANNTLAQGSKQSAKHKQQKSRCKQRKSRDGCCSCYAPGACATADSSKTLWRSQSPFIAQQILHLMAHPSLSCSSCQHNTVVRGGCPLLFCAACDAAHHAGVTCAHARSTVTVVGNHTHMLNVDRQT